jgi:D-alanyl-D-alanine dipeptidase
VLNKKANEAFFVLAVGVFIAAGIILVNLGMNQPNVDYVGETAQTVLANTERQQTSFLALDQAVDQATRQAAQQVFQSNGFPSQTNCSQLGYTVADSNCEQNITQVFQDRLQQNLATAGQTVPDQPRTVTITPDIDFNTWTIGYQSQTSLLYTVESQVSTNTQQPNPAGQTAWGEPVVSVTDIPNVECDTGQSCTGYQKQCAVKPSVYNKLQDLAEYAEDHGLTVRVRSTTRTEEMQRFFAESQAYCQSVKDNICGDDLTDEQCAQKYRERLQSNNMDNRLACNPAGTCTPACDPTTTTDAGQEILNKGCTHMTGNAVDIGLRRPSGSLINNDADLKDPMRKTLCNIGFINNYDEIWHYEYQSPRWRQLRQSDEQRCAYNVNGKDWSTIAPLHEAMTQ